MKHSRNKPRRIKHRIRREASSDSSLSLLVPDRDLVYKDLRKTAFVTVIIIVILIVVTTLPAVQ